MSEFPSSPESEARKEQWLADLEAFIIKAGQNGWAAEATRVEDPQRPGFKELAYENGDWEYRDSYAGYYMAPGSSVVYYKDKPVWYMTYGGSGQAPEHFHKSKETYAFLRKALLEPSPDLPIRGPAYYFEATDKKTGEIRQDWSFAEDSTVTKRQYSFRFEGDLGLAKWSEWISEDGLYTFEQHGDVGLIIDKDQNRHSVLPWEL